MQGYTGSRWYRRAFFWQSEAVTVFTLVYIGLRLVNLQSTLLWADDTLTIPSLTFVPWPQLPQVIGERLLYITGPIFPTALDGIIVNLFGPSILALRVPMVITSALGMLLLTRVLHQLFPGDTWAVWLPPVCYAFSIPSILYAQQIQPTTYFFLATVLQLTVFIPFYRTEYHDPARRRRVIAFVAVSTLAFFFNYISVLVTALLGMIWCIRLYDEVRIRRRLAPRAGLRLFAVFAALHIPLLLLVHNIPFGGQPGRNYLMTYYFLNPLAFLQRTYDLASYHFNYVFDPALYRPLGANVLSLPFVLLVVYGAVMFIRRSRLHVIYTMFAILMVYAASAAAVYPYGGVRHSFTLAPLLYVFAGYAVATLRNSLSAHRILFGGLLVYMIGCWFLWGTALYEERRARLDVAEVARLVEDYDVDYVVFHDEAYDVLALQAHTRGRPLFERDVTLIGLQGIDDLFEVAPDAPFILIAYRTALDAAWENPPGAPEPSIVCDLCGSNVKALISDMGPLPVEGMVAQSIYWPVNGAFVYYVEPFTNP